ncbi:MBL fold metallo-hydrolase [Alphaproteobacteria bacterium]|nr:MBL fold metallo-hydrolase [Alphaproteobacteria bacterium]
MSRLEKITVGSVEVYALRDGELNLPKEVFINLDKKVFESLTNDENSNLSLSNINAYLIKKDNRNLLVDAGCRELFGPNCGFIKEALLETGTKPSDITDIFFTHMHPDHVAGSIDIDGKASFSNAVVKLVDAEYNFWNADHFDNIDVNGNDWANLAKTVFGAYENRIDILSVDAEIIPGVSIINLPGHTPAHSGFRVDDGNKSFIHMGDVLHVPNLQLSDPNISLVFDVDPEAAMKSRKMVFDMVSHDKTLCSSGHMLTPKFGYLEKSSSGYKFVV